MAETRYVIIRDDDTNALTPVECLERLYRPFLDRKLPVNLAVIPDVATSTVTPEQKAEGYLAFKNGAKGNVSIESNHALVNYLHANSHYHVVQHGCHHHWLEFERAAPDESERLLRRGTERLIEAGFSTPEIFVAPYDRLSRSALVQVAKRFRVLSGGWFELKRLPWRWWPRYLIKKLRPSAHWRVGQVLLLSHPGCLLSYHRSYGTMLETIRRQVESQRLTVLVTHWWEYFRDGKPDEAFISVLHETAGYLRAEKNIKVISFDELARQNFQFV